jgi:hypothetical protein
MEVNDEEVDKHLSRGVDMGRRQAARIAKVPGTMSISPSARQVSVKVKAAT